LQSIPNAIEDETLAAAVHIVRINEAHARKAYGLFSYDTRMRTAQKVVDWIEGYSIQEFTVKQLFDRARKWTGIKTRDDLNEPLVLLATRGYIRRKDADAVAYRPSEIYSINPRVWAQKGAEVY
jgi:hypothetical protein